ncbi:MAG: NAD(P)/FAD-dependent oxidoreductase [Anaerolineales bacterium]|nr:NAD(P)/FAD-dependent oxidoreductase [Anaerolineales bacterium]
MKPDEVVIIGAGPAGMTAAIQLKRYGIPFVLLEKERVGGLLWNANLVENYPGFPAGVSGPKLVGLIEKQMRRIGVEVTFDPVSQLARDELGFRVKTLQAEYRPRFAIVASGTKPNPFPFAIPDAARGMVFSDVYHLLHVSDKRIVIIGAGDAAFDYALNLVKKGNFVTILNRGGEVKCLRLLWERAMADSAVEYRAETPVGKVDLDETPLERCGETAGRLRVRTDAGESLEADYLLFAIGRVPQTDFLSDELVGKKGNGLYFVGDVKNGLFRQAAIAAGDGLRAAMEIYTTLNAEA